MAVQVIFFKPRGSGFGQAPVVGEIRAREAVTIPNTTTATVRDGELVMVLNEETAAVLVAYGSTPDAAATAATAATSAGFPVAAGQVSAPIMATAGSKISVKDVP
jgi:hypothetical protein